ncbi:phosphotriesterase [soil metagenome]
MAADASLGEPFAPEPTARTVLGPVAASALGFVLPHEHLIVDNRLHHVPADGLDPDGPVSIDRLADVRVRPHAVRANLVLDDDASVTADLVAYRELGGMSLVELTPRGMGWDPTRLARLARASGVRVIAGTGYYVARCHGDAVAGRSGEDITGELVADLTGPDPGAGVIGEIGISVEEHADEWRVLDAALAASRQTGAPVFIHQTTTAPMRRILDHLERAGADPARVVLCHADYDLRDTTLHRAALAMGLTVEFDLFGMPLWGRGNWIHAPSDTLRVARLLELAADGHAERLLMSQDVCMKVQLRAYGGFGYGHLLRNVRELFDTLGGDEATWRTITIRNPARLLAWQSPVSRAR